MLNFDYTNKIVEYDPLIIGLKKSFMKIKYFHVYGVSKLIINQDNGSYEEKDEKLL